MKALVFWSSGKDSAYALDVLRRQGGVEISGLLTTVNRPPGRVAIHAVREALLHEQAHACGLPLITVPIPDPCPNDVYEAAIGDALAHAKQSGLDAVVFGDLFLEDIRIYRESLLASAGVKPLFPLWQRDTRTLANEMVAKGLRAHVTCVDAKALPDSFAGRVFDNDFLDDLPKGVDPCGENGEFHTFAYAGPMFQRRITVRVGEITQRGPFVYADVLPAAEGER
ncbi:MAG: ATP-binding protein [Acidiferrobacterales bacterium]